MTFEGNAQFVKNVIFEPYSISNKSIMELGNIKKNFVIVFFLMFSVDRH